MPPKLSSPRSPLLPRSFALSTPGLQPLRNGPARAHAAVVGRQLPLPGESDRVLLRRSRRVLRVVSGESCRCGALRYVLALLGLPLPQSLLLDRSLTWAENVGPLPAALDAAGDSGSLRRAAVQRRATAGGDCSEACSPHACLARAPLH